MCDDISTRQLLKHTRPQRSRCRHRCCSKCSYGCSRRLSKHGRWSRCSGCEFPFYIFKLLRGRVYQHIICGVFSRGPWDNRRWLAVLLLRLSAHLRWTRVPCSKPISSSKACCQFDGSLDHSSTTTSLDWWLCSLWSNASEPITLTHCCNKTGGKYGHNVWIWVVAASKHYFELRAVWPVPWYGRCLGLALSVGELFVLACSRHAHCCLPDRGHF